MPSDTAILPEDTEESISGDSITGHFGGLAVGGLDIEYEIRTEALGSSNDIEMLLESTLKATLTAQDINIDDICAELFIQIVTNAESHRLNADHRGKEKPTNVLSFPGEEPHAIIDALRTSGSGRGLPVMLGDIVICGPVIVREANEQGKRIFDHLCHMIVHGFMHLLGHDHTEDEDALLMEAKETVILKQLNVSDPYKIINDTTTDHPEQKNV